MRRPVRLFHVVGLLRLLLLAGCGGGDSEGPDGGDPPTPCEHHEQLASSLGCDPAANSCSAPDIDWERFDACADEFNGWFDCIEQDLTQCYCEADGTANCEGSFKPSEGSALCIAEYTAFDECMAAL